ncbi:SGNH/GDSL hydrolase family protein [Mucilaginibacter sp. ZT4R22]|uniref:SGNH/GDSL hydrolase family protein n=1 Tax=Mucilaginibacter pankratovii TaxID=2772110 RepID=A0ABR7WTH9_9SPHI|nr:SGNH/GDSL hydrolase family protein [Mucilaginibacter pankratovii]MBD1365611.1 SGNH/GDSL hydrolase family protein [Mucilaginibacter pankratovii]
MKKILATILVTTGLFGCSKEIQSPVMPISNPIKPAPVYTDNITYLALGDSYTIGEAVELSKSYPYQLAAQLKQAGHNTANPDIIARTGWTTGDLISAINASGTASKKYDIVTLLIGVNNQYRGNGKDVYRTEFIQLLNTAINYANGDKKHVFVISIPDWGATPFANGYDRNKIAMDIDAFNAINKAETDKQGVAYVDITPISKKAATDASLNASDGLHPSAAMYSLWVNAIAPVVLSQL